MQPPKFICKGEIKQSAGWNARFATYECPYCTKHFEANVSDIKRRRVRHCGCTNLKLSINTPLPPEVNGVVVLGDSGLIGGRRTAIFACPECSRPFTEIVSNIKNKRTLNCGCIRANTRTAKEVKEILERLIRRRFHLRNNPTQPENLKHLKDRIRSLIRRALRRNGYSKTTATHTILGCSMDDFYTHIERQFTDGMGWHNRSLWHIDHIIPVSSATTESELIALNHHTNLRPLWAKDNMSKGSKNIARSVPSPTAPRGLTFNSIKQSAAITRAQENASSLR